MSRQFSSEFRERAVRMLEEALPSYRSANAAAQAIAPGLGASPESVLRWRRLSQRDEDGSERKRIRELEAEVARLQTENQIFEAAAAFFAAKLDRPASK